jgi:hypothetical protein
MHNKYNQTSSDHFLLQFENFLLDREYREKWSCVSRKNLRHDVGSRLCKSKKNESGELME